MNNFAKIKSTLPVVSWDYEGAMNWAKAQVEKYEGLLVTEDQITDIKTIMADINRRKTALDDARKLTRKQLMEPVDKWDAQVRSVMKIFDDAYRALGDQVKAYTEAERESRRAGVQAIIDDVMGNFDIAPFPLPIEEKWLNKTISQKAIREAVTAIIQQRIDADNARIAVEKAKQERRALIEQLVNGKNKTHYGLNLSVAECMTPRLLDLETPVGEVAAEIENIASEKVRRLADLAEKAKAETAPQAEPVKEEKPAQQHPVKEAQKSIMILITYPDSRSEEVKSAALALKALCTTFSARQM